MDIGLVNLLPISTLWSIHILPTQNRGGGGGKGIKTPCSIFFRNDLRVGIHIFVLTILKLQNTKDQKS